MGTITSANIILMLSVASVVLTRWGPRRGAAAEVRPAVS